MITVAISAKRKKQLNRFQAQKWYICNITCYIVVSTRHVILFYTLFYILSMSRGLRSACKQVPSCPWHGMSSAHLQQEVLYFRLLGSYVTQGLCLLWQTEHIAKINHLLSTGSLDTSWSTTPTSTINLLVPAVQFNLSTLFSHWGGAGAILISDNI